MQRISQILNIGSRWVRRKKWILTSVAVTSCLALSAAPAYAIMKSHGKVFTVSDVPKQDVAIVFGAGISRSDGSVSTYLESRLITAINLYRQGKIRVLLMSGDNGRVGYDEPTAMKRYVVAHGVPAKAVVLDYAGFDTYDTCYRAHELFGVNAAVLVSHGYHLPRALLTCSRLGIKSVGVRADKMGDAFPKNYYARELLSLNKASVQLILKPMPTLLGPKEHGVTKALALRV